MYLNRGLPYRKSLTPSSCPAQLTTPPEPRNLKMAYRRSYSRRPRTTRKRTTRPGYGGRSTPRRRYPTRKRRYTKRMTNKRVLNVTSKKKRDHMQQITNMDPTTTQPGGLSSREAILSGNNNFMIPWIATSRPAFSNAGAAGFPIEEAVRTSKTCYMRGLRENISIRTAQGEPWKWRRICFRLKGDVIYGVATSTALVDYLQSGTNAAGVMRPATNWYQDPGLADQIERIIFAGTRNQDWVDPMLATLDSNRISIEYDKTTYLQSGNESGFIRTYKRWHGMNKNLYYDDDQSGSGEALRPYSTEGIKGMGDYYVIDYFRSNGSVDASIGLRYNSTLYWHEK